ncbi:MAG: hypothetical protein IK115_12725 [Lachnospiraceae bacterium]|nr:hypothetical protein [Lachnospiraceae bacterium]
MKGASDKSIWIAAVLLALVADALLFWIWLGGAPVFARADTRGSISMDGIAASKGQQNAEAKEAGFRPEGSGWQTGEGSYYFTKDGAFYFLGKKTENYIRGTALITELTTEQLSVTAGDELLGAVEDAHYYRIEVQVNAELYFGRLRESGSYVLYIAMNPEKAYIFDSGWGESEAASRVEIPLQAVLDDPFREEVVAEARPWGAAGDPSVFAREGVDFTYPPNERAYWNAAYIGDRMYYKLEGELCMTIPSSGYAPRPMVTPEEGWCVTLLGRDGQELIYGLGLEGEGSLTRRLFRMDPKTELSELLVEDTLQDFSACNGLIYYTDYNTLKRIEADGSVTTLWENGVYSYEVTEDRIYVFDGDRWELLDAESGEDLGYICEGKAYSMECDRSIYADDYLYYVAYDYARESISLRALSIWTGEERIVGEEYAGKKSDTYNVLFIRSYAFFTAENGERLVRINVADGTSADRYIKDAGYDFATEILNIEGQPVLHGYNEVGRELFLWVEDSLDLAEVGVYTEPLTP